MTIDQQMDNEIFYFKGKRANDGYLMFERIATRLRKRGYDVDLRRLNRGPFGDHDDTLHIWVTDNQKQHMNIYTLTTEIWGDQVKVCRITKMLIRRHEDVQI